MNQNHKKGFSLIEMLLVIGVLAVLLIGAFVVYPRVQESQQIQNESQNLITMQAGIINYFESQGNNYNSLGAYSSGQGVVFANRAGIIPATLNNGNKSASTATHTWGGVVIIHTTSGIYNGYAGGRNFVVRYNGVPSSACPQLVLNVFNSFGAVMIVTANNQTFEENGMNISALTTACNVRDKVDIAFISR